MGVAGNPRVEFEPKRDLVLSYTTPIVYVKVHDSEALDGELKRLILTEEKAKPGVTKSNIRGWHSDTDLAQWDKPAVKTLFGLIDPVVRRLSGFLVGREPWGGGMRYTAWANVNRAGSYNKMHNHPGFHWSGVYYVDVGERDAKETDSGKIEFQDPRGFVSMLPIPGKPFGQTTSIRPRSGALLIFPSFIYHAVTPYTGAGERISIAFNVLLEGESGWKKDAEGGRTPSAT